MNLHDANRLIEVVKSLVEPAHAHRLDTDTPTKQATKTSADIPRLVKPGNGTPAEGLPANIAPALRDPDTLEWLFRQFRNRMIDSLREDPIFLQLLANQPELVVEITPKLVTLEGSTLKGRVGKLIAAGFFEGGKRHGEARTELTRTGSEPNSGQLSTLFSEFVRDGFLEKTPGDRYIKSPGLKVTEKRLEA
jgi:hypothetical protein